MPSCVRFPRARGFGAWLLSVLAVSACSPVTTWAQAAPSAVQAGIGDQEAASSLTEAQAGDEQKRMWGIIPNYRTSPTLLNYQPLTAREKWRMAADDAFDRGTFMLAAAFGGEAQLTHATPSYGHGLAAYARYFTASTADFMIGDALTEGVYPVILHQDPRYFRKGEGSGAARLGYAVAQMFWTHTDADGGQFNVSEVAGNATAVAIGNAYYPNNRSLSNNLFKLGTQLAVDMVANILKEFSPDLDSAFSRRKFTKSEKRVKFVAASQSPLR